MLENFGLPKPAIQNICNTFNQNPKITLVQIYGSRARNDYRNNSDIDICLSGEELTLADILNLQNQLDELLLPWEIDLVAKNSIKNLELLKNIEKDGVQIC